MLFIILNSQNNKGYTEAMETTAFNLEKKERKSVKKTLDNPT